jgi:hypothetical protein
MYLQPSVYIQGFVTALPQKTLTAQITPELFLETLPKVQRNPKIHRPLPPKKRTNLQRIRGRQAQDSPTPAHPTLNLSYFIYTYIHAKNTTKERSVSDESTRQSS